MKDKGVERVKLVMDIRDDGYNVASPQGANLAFISRQIEVMVLKVYETLRGL